MFRWRVCESLNVPALNLELRDHSKLLLAGHFVFQTCLTPPCPPLHWTLLYFTVQRLRPCEINAQIFQIAHPLLLKHFQTDVYFECSKCREMIAAVVIGRRLIRLDTTTDTIRVDPIYYYCSCPLVRFVAPVCQYIMISFRRFLGEKGDNPRRISESSFWLIPSLKWDKTRVFVEALSTHHKKRQFHLHQAVGAHIEHFGRHVC